MKVKVCFVYSDVDSSHLIDNTEKFLDKNKYQVTTVFIGQKIPTLHQILKDRNSAVYFIEYSSRKQIFSIIRRLREIFTDIKPDIVHTHLFNASLTGLIAAKLSGIKRVHTRHHSTECHLYYPHAVYYDKFINLLSQRIVAISSQVADVLINREGAAAEKVKIIRHGFDLTEFKSTESVTVELKQQYNLIGHHPIIGVISQFVHWKGIQFIIPAFKLLTAKHPKAKLVLANAGGPYTEQLKKLLKENLHESQYVLIKYEKRIFDLYKTFDVFVHTPIDREVEAFGQIYVEALAMEIPSVFTLSGVADDFIIDKSNAVVVPFGDSQAIFEGLELILRDAELRRRISHQGKEDVWKMFTVNRFVNELDALYTELTG